MKTLVLFYSKRGSNEYVAQKIAKTLNCDIEAIVPRLDAPFLLLMGINFGNKKLHHRLEDYDRIILCGPIWMGKFIMPFKRFVQTNMEHIKQLVFVTCCGSSYEKKDEKFGYGVVFKEVEALLKGKCTLCQAFPIPMVLPEDERNDAQIVAKTSFNDENFKGEIRNRFEEFIQKIERHTSLVAA